jgi:hypothetical protein
MKNTSNVNVMFFHGRTIDNHRFTISGTLENGIFNFGIAVCGNKEHFCRAKGRLISTGRVLNQRSICDGRISKTILPSTETKDFTIFAEAASMYNKFTKEDLLKEFHLKRKKK